MKKQQLTRQIKKKLEPYLDWKRGAQAEEKHPSGRGVRSHNKTIKKLDHLEETRAMLKEFKLHLMSVPPIELELLIEACICWCSYDVFGVLAIRQKNVLIMLAFITYFEPCLNHDSSGSGKFSLVGGGRVGCREG